MNEVTNPLDLTDTFLIEAIYLTYDYVVKQMAFRPFNKNFTPFNDGYIFPPIHYITRHLKDHFVQELAMYVMNKQCFESVGASDKEDFMQKVIDKEYHRYVPVECVIEDYLNQLNLSYTHTEVLPNFIANDPIVEVW